MENEYYKVIGKFLSPSKISGEMEMNGNGYMVGSIEKNGRRMIQLRRGRRKD